MKRIGYCSDLGRVITCESISEVFDGSQVWVSPSYPGYGFKAVRNKRLSEWEFIVLYLK